MISLIFKFKEKAYSQLKNFSVIGKFNDTADAIGCMIQLSSSLQQQALQGFTEIIVRNPKTGEEKVIKTPKNYLA